MTNYNDGKWHGWNGGKCPVHPESIVVCAFTQGSPLKRKAYEFSWDLDTTGLDVDIIAFRVVKEHKEPREFYAVYSLTDYAWTEVSSGFPGSVLFREVIE